MFIACAGSPTDGERANHGDAGTNSDTGTNGDAGTDGDAGTGNETSLPALPKAVDLSATKYFPPIGDQGDIGSCDWFAAVYYQMTYTYNRAQDRACDPSNTFSPKFGYTILNNAGPYPFNIRLSDVYQFIERHGSATIAQVPYDMAGGSNYLPWCTDGDIWQAAISHRIAGSEYFEYRPGSTSPQSIGDFAAYVNEIKHLLSAGEVLVFQSTPDPALITMGTIANDPATPDDDARVGESIVVAGVDGPDHTMAMVGYDDRIWVDINHDGLVQANEKGAFKIADSFGPNEMLHNQGFLWLSQNALDGSIYLNRFHRMSVRSNYQPHKVARITLRHAKRDALRFQFGRSATSDKADIDPSHIFDPFGLGFGVGEAGVSLIAGGAVPFDGGTTAMDGSFAFDLTDMDDGSSDGYWYLRIANAGDSPLTIQSFEVRDLEHGPLTKDSDLPVTVTSGEFFRFIPRSSP